VGENLKNLGEERGRKGKQRASDRASGQARGGWIAPNGEKWRGKTREKKRKGKRQGLKKRERERVRATPRECLQAARLRECPRE